MEYGISSGAHDGFLRQLWFGIRNFVGGGLVAAAFGVAIAVICLAIGLVLRALLEAAQWLFGLF